MILKNFKKRTAFQVASPNELNEKITEVLNRGGKRGSCAVAVDEPKAMICPFEMEMESLKDLETHLLNEAVELTGLTSDELVLDYQLTRNGPGNIAGYYICIPKEILEKYIRVMDKRLFNPVKLTDRFLVSIDALYQQGKINGGRVCFLDFQGHNAVNLFIANGTECELLRKLRYEDYEEARKEIIQSLRSASAKSRLKHYDHIYYYGPMEQRDQLIDGLKKAFHAQAEELSTPDYPAALCGSKTFFNLNLLKKYIFSPGQMQYIHWGVNVILAICALNFLILWGRIGHKNKLIHEKRSHYQASDLKYALELKKNLQ